MDKIYKNEVNSLRNWAHHPAEATLLAFDRKAFEKLYPKCYRIPFLFLLFKHMFEYVRSTRRIKELVACYHPRHARLYQFLNFQPMGDPKTYDEVNGRPAVAGHLNLTRTEESAKDHVAYKVFFSGKVRAEKFMKRYKFNPRDTQRLYNIIPELFDTINPTHLMRIFPEINTSQKIRAA